MSTATESHQIAVTVSHGSKQRVDFLLADGRVDDVAELEEQVLGQPALLLVVDQPEGVHNGRQGPLMQLKIPPQQDLQAAMHLS